MQRALRKRRTEVRNLLRSLKALLGKASVDGTERALRALFMNTTMPHTVTIKYNVMEELLRAGASTSEAEHMTTMIGQQGSLSHFETLRSVHWVYAKMPHGRIERFPLDACTIANVIQ